MDKDNLPEAMKESKNKVDSVFLRTVIRKDVYDRIKEFALRFSTGRGDWDFGVAVQILLDLYEESKIQRISDKLDMILGVVSQRTPEDMAKDKTEKKYQKLLGGEKIVLGEE